MKRILNLNDFSLPALKVIAIISLGIPAALFLAAYLLDRAGLHLPLLERLIWVSFGIGGILILLFFLLVVLEQVQDHMLYKRYLQQRGQPAQGECPFCGNRMLRSFEYFCPMCGQQLKQKE